MKIGLVRKNLALALGGVGVLGVSLLLTGCDKVASFVTPKPLKCASVNTTKVLQLDSEYQNLAQEYFNARIKLAGELRQTVEKNGGTIQDQATYDKFARAEHELNATWLEITRQYTKKKMDAVASACTKIVSSKGLDIVLLDSDEIPTVEYGAIDITADVMVELSNFAGTGEKSEAQPESAGQSESTSQDSAGGSGASQAAPATDK